MEGFTNYGYTRLADKYGVKMLDTRKTTPGWRDLEKYAVHHVMNFTDVDDKIIRDASRDGITIGELTDRYTQTFLDDLARLRFYRGVAEWNGGDRNKAALDEWRSTAVLKPDFQPDATVLPDTEAQDAFYAIASEVKGYAEASLALPEDTRLLVLAPVVAARKGDQADLLEELEYSLITADIGVRTATEILESIRQQVDRRLINDAGELKTLIRRHLLEAL